MTLDDLDDFDTEDLDAGGTGYEDSGAEPALPLREVHSHYEPGRDARRHLHERDRQHDGLFRRPPLRPSQQVAGSV
jgi:hypothetical protein